MQRGFSPTRLEVPTIVDKQGMVGIYTTVTGAQLKSSWICPKVAYHLCISRRWRSLDWSEEFHRYSSLFIIAESIIFIFRYRNRFYISFDAGGTLCISRVWRKTWSTPITWLTYQEIYTFVGIVWKFTCCFNIIRYDKQSVFFSEQFFPSLLIYGGSYGLISRLYS